MAKTTAAVVVHRTAAAAWAHFRDRCAVEPDGRDQDFVEQLLFALDPDATELDAALAGATTDALVRAMFGAVAPFAAMSRDILAFFSRAGARRGPEQWALVVADVPLGLDDLTDFISETRRVFGHFDRPVLESAHAFSLMSMLSSAPRSSPPTDVVQWSRDFLADGVYGPWPASLEPSGLPGVLRDVADIARTTLDEVRASGMRHVPEPEFMVPADYAGSILDGRALELAERDHFLRNMINGLTAAAGLPASKLATLAGRLADFLADLPRRHVVGEVETEELERILSLPVWRRRHEVYAVWVATEIVAAMPARTVVHHDGGEIRFAFRRTRVASVAGNGGQIVLFAERKQPLSNPIGKARTARVQPDFGLWRENEAGDRCALVVEVKHYAVPAARSFGEALVDYARAHREAEVVLVNYGPVAQMVDRLDDPADPVAARCHTIAELTPLQYSAKARLAALVSEALRALDASHACLVVDISASMRPQLQRDAFRDWLEGSAKEDVDRVVLADCQLRWEGARDEALDRIARHSEWTGEDLASVAHVLLVEEDEVRFVTDAGGYRDLKEANGLEMELVLEGSPPGLILVAVRLRGS